MYIECRHILPSGSKCHSPALSGKPFCYYHANLHARRATPGLPAKRLPTFHIEDARGIQMALQQVLAAVESPYVHPRSIGLALYGLQLAIQIVDRAKAPEATETVRSLCDSAGAPLPPASPIDDATELLAPANTVCDPGTDCARCLNHDDCPNSQDPDDDPHFEPDDDEDADDEHEDDEDDDDDEEEDDDDEDDDDDEEEEDEDDGEDDEEDDDEEDDEEEEEDEEEDDGDDDEGDEEEDDENPASGDRDDDEDAVVNAALRILRETSQRPRRRSSTPARRKTPAHPHANNHAPSPPPASA